MLTVAWSLARRMTSPLSCHCRSARPRSRAASSASSVFQMCSLRSWNATTTGYTSASMGLICRTQFKLPSTIASTGATAHKVGRPGSSQRSQPVHAQQCSWPLPWLTPSLTSSDRERRLRSQVDHLCSTSTSRAPSKSTPPTIAVLSNERGQLRHTPVW